MARREEFEPPTLRFEASRSLKKRRLVTRRGGVEARLSLIGFALISLDAGRLVPALFGSDSFALGTAPSREDHQEAEECDKFLHGGEVTRI